MASAYKPMAAAADYAVNWQTINPKPKLGELCFSIDTQELRIGDGTSNFNALLPITGGSGATTYTALSDSATADLPNLNTKLATQLALKTPFKVQIVANTLIPLDTDGNGKYMPAIMLTANTVFGVGPNPVEQGNCNFALIGDGSHVPDFSAFVNANGYTYSATLNASNIYAAEYSYGTPLLYGVLGNPVVISSGGLLLESSGYLLLEDGVSHLLL